MEVIQRLIELMGSDATLGQAAAWLEVDENSGRVNAENVGEETEDGPVKEEIAAKARLEAGETCPSGY